MFKDKEKTLPAAEATGEAKPEFPSDRTSGSGTAEGYTVEARFMYVGRSEVIAGVALGPTWVTLHFPESPIGVPKGNVGWGHLPDTSLLPLESAQALRWWFLATANASRPTGALCVETRLIKHRCEYSFKEIATEAIE